ncbi:Restriction endonuclease [Salinivirga cyanobacteriivorans]|uniref:Restriction endonuclease n=1 Tax=Salinivirga cyanobacteriivorans TaxID=1307839 RepID=A0A0S2HWT1_9BACT|nr:restriction endonuclease [Salinivirga cyanobacteriivorans]ALO14466.1 Restriction endonuclease [Salinivirga cyanobacteriivorans]
MDINTEYELLTKEIFETLLKDDGVTIDVQHNVDIQGKAFKHQIDVYWEYQIAGITHKVAIECKNYNSNVSVAKVRDFYGVLSDIGNINGIMVSKKGFQKGAKEFAEHYGINLRELREPNDKDWKGRIKTIQVNMNIVMPQVKERKFHIDEEWVKKNIELPEKVDFSYQLSGMADEIWIVDGNGKKLKNMHQLDNELPHNWEKEENVRHFYEFDDGYIEIEQYGKIKLNSIEYLYDVHAGEPKPIIIDGTASAKAILKDAITGEIKFFNKDGTIK